MEMKFNTDKIEVLHEEIGLWRIPQFFNSGLLSFVEKKILSTNFNQSEWGFVNDNPAYSEMLCSSPQTIVLNGFLQNPEMIKRVAEVTHTQLRHVHSRVYKFVPSMGNSFDWHSDMSGTRTIGFSVNISPRPYTGGVFMIKRLDRPELQTEFQNIGYGDAILFRISNKLRHCVSPLSGDAERVACAGWFLS